MISFIRRPAVEAMCGRKHSKLYADIAQGLFTKPVSLNGSSRGPVGWPEHEIEALNRARLQGRTNEQIKVLVAELMAARTAAQPC